ncbi:MAG TPA: MFS transporter [Candidatus Alistipes intestinigallinarum]|uniref:MFS transporter n=1 Tax=Candidatus Alistipes intestinigallinarum TaxID=2838440 RepID=A0A9D1Z087_9BACT|nr:MFS transporter [Candidatus Alistipes intestinigallinarum]
MQSWKRTFAVIWSGQAISILSSSIVAYAIIFWMSVETRSAEVLALSAIAGMLPQAVLGLFVGVYIDRWDRKRTMILADSFIALCTLGLAVLFWLDTAELWHVYLLLACRSVGSAFHVPAMQASVPLLAPQAQLTRIAGVNQVITSFSDLIGPALGALLLGLTSIGNILLLDVLGALIACTTLLFIHIPNPERPDRRPDLWREFREGFAAMHSQPGLGWFFGLAIAVWFLIMPVGVLFPLMTLNHFGGGTWEMSFVEIIWGGGALLGGAIMGARNYPVNRIVLINLMYLVVGLSFLFSGLLPVSGFYWFTALTAAAGVSSSVFNASFVSVLQTRIEAGMLGRVLSLYRSFGLLPSVLGLLSTGFLAERVGLTTTFILSGSLICLLSIVAFCIPSVLRLDRRK